MELINKDIFYRLKNNKIWEVGVMLAKECGLVKIGDSRWSGGNWYSEDDVEIKER